MEKLEWCSIEKDLKEHFIASAENFSSKICDSIQLKYDEARNKIEQERKDMMENFDFERRKFEEEKQREINKLNEERLSNHITF